VSHSRLLSAETTAVLFPDPAVAETMIRARESISLVSSSSTRLRSTKLSGRGGGASLLLITAVDRPASTDSVIAGVSLSIRLQG
jgi:hypothetical protein